MIFACQPTPTWEGHSINKGKFYQLTGDLLYIRRPFKKGYLRAGSKAIFLLPRNVDCIVYNWLKAKNYYFLTITFLMRLFKIAPNQADVCYQLFAGPRSSDDMKFYRKM